MCIRLKNVEEENDHQIVVHVELKNNTINFYEKKADDKGSLRIFLR